MPTECERLIAETLRLDAEATKGPWERHDMTVGQVAEGYFRSVAHFTNGPFTQRTKDASLMADYRTAAPRLARMLRVAIECLVSEEDNPHIGNAKALAEIERIAKEETDGSQR